MPRKRKKSIDEMFLDGTEIDAALKRAVREAVRQHKAAGLPMVVWKDGKVVWIPPEELDPDATEEDQRK